jgi:SAM-dependent methyltransferase
VFVHGDAAHMPFVDDAFDLVLSRFAVHHFERPEEQISEMVRVCRPDGRIAIIDLVAPDPASAPVRASSTRPSTITGCRSSAGSPRRRRPQTGRRQSEPSSPPSWRAARRPGCAPSSRTGELRLTHRYGIVVARKVARSAT